jgi:hypothetical protein
LRAFFEYRDLGIKEATGGRVGGHVIRAKPGAGHGSTGWHRHALDVQLVYILKGWVRFDYEGVGEILEITLPAEFETEAVAAPEAISAGASRE